MLPSFGWSLLLFARAFHFLFFSGSVLSVFSPMPFFPPSEDRIGRAFSLCVSQGRMIVLQTLEGLSVPQWFGAPTHPHPSPPSPFNSFMFRRPRWNGFVLPVSQLEMTAVEGLFLSVFLDDSCCSLSLMLLSFEWSLFLQGSQWPLGALRFLPHSFILGRPQCEGFSLSLSVSQWQMIVLEGLLFSSYMFLSDMIALEVLFSFCFSVTW